MSSWINNTLTSTTIGLLVAAAINQQTPSTYREPVEAALVQTKSTQSAAPPLQSAPAAPSRASGSPRQLRFNLSLSSPQDLKVKQGDQIMAGQVLADRVAERSRLTSQRQALQMSLQQISGTSITTPPTPLPVPQVNRLPPVSYAEEEAAIAAAGMDLQQAERAFQLQQQSLLNEPLEEASAVTRAAVAVQNYQRLVDNQKRKIDAVAMLKDLPDSVSIHEQEVLKQKEAELQQAQADYQQAQSKLSTASKTQTEKLQQLAQSLEKARAQQQLASAKLQTKKDQRAHTEYEASVTAARRTEERNQAQQSYSWQLQQAEQQQRERKFQVAQLQAKITEFDDKLQALSSVTSPYSGVIKRLKVVSQNDKELAVELVLSVGGTTVVSPSPANSTPAPLLPSPPSHSRQGPTPSPAEQPVA